MCYFKHVFVTSCSNDSWMNPDSIITTSIIVCMVQSSLTKKIWLLFTRGHVCTINDLGDKLITE